MSYAALSGTTMASGVTTVDCQKQVRSWRLLRSLIELLIPSCHCTFIEDHEMKEEKNFIHHYYFSTTPFHFSSKNNITGTIFGFRHGKVNFCIQTGPKSTSPILLLELAVPTTILAREMRSGILRIALESTMEGNYNVLNSHSLLLRPVWTMYCNGRKVGFAIKRQPRKGDMDILRSLGTVVVGTGVVSAEELELNREDEIMYLRGNFERVYGSANSESFHLIDPDGSIGQLSIFFLSSM